MLPYVAYLRVYEPLVAFSEPQRAAWAAYAASSDRPNRTATLDEEHAQSIRHLVAVPSVVAPERESKDAYIRRLDGVTYVCPWQTRLRSWQALVEFLASFPDDMADSFVPRAVAEQVTADFERWKHRHPSVRPHILTSTWHVPLPWFVPFESAERWLVLGDVAAGGRDASGPTTAAPARTLVYMTPMVQARRRVARALAVIKRNLGNSRRLVGVEELGRWLEEFHPKSLVELDYGGLVHLLDDAALRADQSVAEVSASLTGLETGEQELAVAMYQRVTERWRAVQALESAN